MANDGPGTFLLCVDRYQGGIAKGTAYNGYEAAGRHFDDLMGFVKTADSLMDAWAFPQAYLRRRGFNEQNLAGSDVEIAERRRGLTRPTPAVNLMHLRGECGTFWIKVLYRRNASWQGQAAWVPPKARKASKSFIFRSVLELTLAIDEQLLGWELRQVLDKGRRDERRRQTNRQDDL